MARRRKGVKRRRGRRFGARVRAAGHRTGRRLRRGRGHRARMGLLGKAGVALAGGLPLGWAAIGAIKPWTSWTDQADFTVKLKGSAAIFANTLTVGFGLPIAIQPAYVGPLSTGEVADVQTPINSGAWTGTTGAGLGLIVIDGVIGAVYRFLAGAKVRPKIMGRQMISG